MLLVRKIFFFLFLLANLTSVGQIDMDQEYLSEWRAFYPSKSVDLGIHASVYSYEDYSKDRIDAWLNYNKKMEKLLADPVNPYRTGRPINARLLYNQISNEIYKWEITQPHLHDLQLYTKAIAQSVQPVWEAVFLLEKEKADIICQRLQAVIKLCTAAQNSLTTVEATNLSQGIRQLEKAKNAFNAEFSDRIIKHSGLASCSTIHEDQQLVVQSIEALIKHISKELKPKSIKDSKVLGITRYAEQLARYTDSALSPEELADIALEEIHKVRTLIEDVSAHYLSVQYPDKSYSDASSMVKAAFENMEKDAPENGADYLKFWEQLSRDAISFIEKNKIASLPEFQTLRIMSAPESAGAAARIGWVDSAPPFSPNPLTTLYLPSVPDTLPEQEKIDFWSSFNKPFNRMIVIHELFPGHYMQIKISRETSHPIRLYFPYPVYFEGWATFCEWVLLDAGWEKERPLTYLAHLRKRLENANRAYTSVQVHCNNWTQEQVLKFSTETALLAPQFAKSLWGRIMRSPMQLTSYFLGGKQFTALLKAEKERLGTNFNLQLFMDTIMKAGPIPIDAFYEIFKNR